MTKSVIYLGNTCLPWLPHFVDKFRNVRTWKTCDGSAGAKLPAVNQLSYWRIHTAALHLASVHCPALWSTLYRRHLLLQLVPEAAGADMPVAVSCCRYAKHAAELPWDFLPVTFDVCLVERKLQSVAILILLFKTVVADMMYVSITDVSYKMWINGRWRKLLIEFQHDTDYFQVR